MFGWLFGRHKKKESDIHIHLHVDGSLKLYHAERPGNPTGNNQGPIKADAPAEDSMGNTREHQDPEALIDPSLFADTDTPEVDFGHEVGPSSGPDKD
jgi:hypothetical protein